MTEANITDVDLAVPKQDTHQKHDWHPDQRQ